MCMKVSVCFELLFFHLGWAVLVICKEVLRVYVREDFLAWHDSERGREGGGMCWQRYLREPCGVVRGTNGMWVGLCLCLCLYSEWYYCFSF